ncbi:MAG: hypothetical protein M3413_02430 [Bacteroidota bacterium]|nr:hypothetical protein [Flavisolibacter sp.]MDQ3550358.1 hypothetical protein [Bacteroidota bacterium]
MINHHELRLGNFLLQKINNRISTVLCNFKHFEMCERGETKDLFPVVLKPEIFLKCSFIENKEYALLPHAKEFYLPLPLQGKEDNRIYGYMKSNGESFCRASVNNLICSNNFFHLHQLQNLHFFLTGKELEFKP